MQYFKLQLGCLLIIAYIEISYIRATLRGKIPRNRLYDALMVVAPWAVLFDGVSAWTVNHMDIVPDIINRGAHLLFFIFMEMTLVATAEYMYDQLLSFKNRRRVIFLSELPGIVSVALAAAGIGRLRFIQGTTTWYSMGFSVYVCYATVILYYGSILYIIIARRRFLPRGKKLNILSFVVLVGVILAVQLRFPEVLLTSLFPTFLLLGIYMDFENPYIREVTAQHNEMVDGFATMVESRDNNTGGHIKRTRAYVELMLSEMRRSRRYRAIMSRDYMENVGNAAPLHDIGKISTPDSILQKPGKLTPEEFEIMKMHAPNGAEIILNTFHDLNNEEFRHIAYELARYHHEKYNGKGYPDGLAGEEIPLHARIMAIADVFDAVSQRRCYRDALPVDECFDIIRKGSGADFDPELVEIFLGARGKVEALMKKE